MADFHRPVREIIRLIRCPYERVTMLIGDRENHAVIGILEQVGMIAVKEFLRDDMAARDKA